MIHLANGAFRAYCFRVWGMSVGDFFYDWDYFCHWRASRASHLARTVHWLPFSFWQARSLQQRRWFLSSHKAFRGSNQMQSGSWKCVAHFQVVWLIMSTLKWITATRANWKKNSVQHLHSKQHLVEPWINKNITRLSALAVPCTYLCFRLQARRSSCCCYPTSQLPAPWNVPHMKGWAWWSSERMNFQTPVLRKNDHNWPHSHIQALDEAIMKRSNYSCKCSDLISLSQSLPSTLAKVVDIGHRLLITAQPNMDQQKNNTLCSFSAPKRLPVWVQN